MYRAQLVGAVEYTDWISAESPTPNECLGYDIKLSDCKTSALQIWSTPSFLLLPGPL